MRFLTPEDEYFLLAHGPATPMQIGALVRLDVPEEFRDRFAEDVVRHLARRVPATPLAVRLEESPLGFTTAGWLDVAAVDVDEQVRVVDRPMDRDELRQSVAAEARRPLDLRRAPFRVVVLDRVVDGPPAVLVTVHHALADGMGFQSVLGELMDPSPVAAERAPRRRRDERRPPAPWWIATSSVRFARDAWRRRQQAGELAAAREAYAAFRRDPANRQPPAPDEVLAGPTSDARSYDMLSLPLPAFKAIARALGGTVNDVFLTVGGGAVRRHLQAVGALPEQPVVALAARSYRRPEHGDLGNYIVSLQPHIGTHIADPVERLHAIQASVAIARRRSELQEPLLSVADGPFGARARRRRYAERSAATGGVFKASVAFSNVPGPAEPRWLAGYPVLANHPTPAVGSGRFLNVTLRRYRDALDLGVMTDAAKVPDAAVISEHLVASLSEVADAAGVTL